jgi:hypothetical protein
VRTPFRAASAASAAVVSPLPRRITSGSTRGSETRIRAPSRSGERRPQHLVDEHGDRAKGGAAGAEDGRVEALQELPGHVDRDVRARLEVRTDGADRDAPRLDAQTVLQRPRILCPLELRQLRELGELRGNRVDSRVGEAEPVERARVEVGGGDVVGIRRGDRVTPLRHELRGARERTRHGVVRQRRDRGVRRGGLALDVLAQGHPVFLSAAAMPAIERRRGGTHDSSPPR